MRGPRRQRRGSSRAFTTAFTRAFTLIELLVVIVILGVLMAVALPTYLRQQSKAKDSNAKSQLTYAYRAIRSSLPEFNDAYPSVSSVVSAIAQSEPELTVTSGACTASTDDKHVTVDPVLTNAAKLALYTKSKSGTWWRLSAGTSGAQVFTPLGTCVGALSQASATVSGNEITDTVRAANAPNTPDGLSADSSYGIWPPATNLLTKASSDPFTAGQLSASGVTITALGNGRYQLVNTTGVLKDYAYRLLVNLADLTNGQAYTGSVFYSNLSGGNMRLDWCDQLGAGTWYTPSAPSGRASVTASRATYDSTYRFLDIELAAGASVTVWWPQVEAGSIVTPYVSAPGARAGAEVTAPATLLSPTQGWVAARFRPSFGSSSGDPGYNAYVFSWGRSQTAGTDWIALRRPTGSGSNWNFVMEVNQVAIVNTNVPVTWNPGDVLTMVLSWDANSLHLSVNGGGFISTAKSTPGAIPAIVQAQFEIGTYTSTYGYLTGEMHWFAAGTGTLSDSDAATINGWGDNDPTTQDFPVAAAATMAWSADTSTYVTGN